MIPLSTSDTAIACSKPLSYGVYQEGPICHSHATLTVAECEVNKRHDTAVGETANQYEGSCEHEFAKCCTMVT